MGFSLHVCIFFFFFLLHICCFAWAWCAKGRGWSQLTVFDKLAQPAPTGFGRVLHALACTHACVCVGGGGACLHCKWEGQGWLEVKKRCSLVLHNATTGNILNIFSWRQEPRAWLAACVPFQRCPVHALKHVWLFTLICTSERLTRVCMFLCLFPAPIPFRRAEEATSRRHRPHHLTSKQLVSQDFRSPYLRHQHGSAFHYEQLSPPSPC